MLDKDFGIVFAHITDGESAIFTNSLPRLTIGAFQDFFDGACCEGHNDIVVQLTKDHGDWITNEQDYLTTVVP